ncbi:MAG TPA: CotS family spore coat protein [Lachnospiraceae bacterium]|nr:CotS family spore coat protein [Lachnospiraceae bacterium]
MNDKAVSVLDNYELKVLRTWKGRGAILCDTNQGLKIIKEYIGPKDKLPFIDKLLLNMREAGQFSVDCLIKNKEDELFSCDRDQVTYIVKDYYDGRECNVKDIEECEKVVRHLAKMHKFMILPNSIDKNTFDPTQEEFEKHNRELIKIKKYIRIKSQKTDFELFLLKSYDLFLTKAIQVVDDMKRKDLSNAYLDICGKGIYCHGEFQYHNIMICNSGMAVINFEKCLIDSQIRDLYYFMRKVMEKTNWSETVGNMILESYDKEKTLTTEEKSQLYYRFLYPEKFWKIVNFYYNTGKAWIPGRNMEKLEKLLKQEEEKMKFLEHYL